MIKDTTWRERAIDRLHCLLFLQVATTMNEFRAALTVDTMTLCTGNSQVCLYTCMVPSSEYHPAMS